MPTPRPHSIQETLYDANIVVHVVAGPAQTVYPEQPATLTIKCVFKDRLNELPDDSTMIALDTDQFTSCSGPWPMTPGEELVMALRATTPEGKFVPDEAENNAMERATFPANDETFGTVLSLCGLQTPTGTQCPQEIPEEEDCEHAPYNSVTTQSTGMELTNSTGTTGMELTTTDNETSVAATIKGHTFLTLITLLLLSVIQ